MTRQCIQITRLFKWKTGQTPVFSQVAWHSIANLL